MGRLLHPATAPPPRRVKTPTCTHTPVVTPEHTGHSRDTRPWAAPALRPGLSQAAEQPAREGNGLALVLLVQLSKLSLLPAPELHQHLVASELVQRGRGHL